MRIGIAFFVAWSLIRHFGLPINILLSVFYLRSVGVLEKGLRHAATEDILTTGEVAKICNVAPRTVSKWFDSGQLRGYRIPGSKDRRIPLNALIRFMKAHNIPLDGLQSGHTRVLIVDDESEIIDVLDAGDMPPEDEPQLKPADRSAMLTSLKAMLASSEAARAQLTQSLTVKTTEKRGADELVRLAEERAAETLRDRDAALAERNFATDSAQV